MAIHRDRFPDIGAELLLTYVGMETDLIFTRGVDLPGFASFPLLETQEGRNLLRQYFKDMITLGDETSKVTGKESGKETGRKTRVGVILESPTWVANRDRGAEIGYGPEALRRLNQQAIALMAEVRAANGDLPTVISANIGPRGDAYAPDRQMDAEAADRYHTEQISALAETEADVVSGYTIAYTGEAIGIVRAARRFGLPVVISFTVETDGRLPSGTPLKEAVCEVDAATKGYAAYFMINCAHPDHFAAVLEDAPWMARVKGIAANASRCSHAELDTAKDLDDGDPDELAEQLFRIRRQFPHIRVLGGCCGTDMRHMTKIAKATVQGSM
jgi:homocysteine S-methyltransferase